MLGNGIAGWGGEGAAGLGGAGTDGCLSLRNFMLPTAQNAATSVPCALSIWGSPKSPSHQRPITLA